MRIAVIGGKLQGIEIIYLSHKAGFETLLIDRNHGAPAQALARQFMAFHFQTDGVWPSNIGKIDIVFPALEDIQTLEFLSKWANHLDVPIVLDLKAFRISSSKILSNALFKKLRLPMPDGQDKLSFPLVVKPDQASGSQGVVVVRNEQALDAALHHSFEKVVIQQFIEGPAFSIEVIGIPGDYHTLEVTDLFMDKDYDCSGVSAPSVLDGRLKTDLHCVALAVATEISLHGIMDLETILHNGEHKLLEIDARFPSQTPITVYLATGKNMVEMLVDLFLHGCVNNRETKQRYARIDHIHVNDQGIRICGEHIMANHGPVHHVCDFFGADEALTTCPCRSEKKEWVATLMFMDDSKKGLMSARSQCLRKITSIFCNAKPL